MEIIFARHGSDEYDEKGLIHPPEAPLSTKGLSQARALARRLSDMRIDEIVSSPYARAAQTADLVASALGKKVVHSDLLREWSMPRTMHGKPMADAESQRVREEMWQHAGNPEWHPVEGETFSEARRRSAEALAYVENLNVHRVLAVAHGNIIRLMLLQMMFGDGFDPQIARGVLRFHNMANTGLTVCSNDQGIWRMITWNDFSHLKDYLLNSKEGH